MKTEGAPLLLELFGGSLGAEQEPRRVARRGVKQKEDESHHTPHHGEAHERADQQVAEHPANVDGIAPRSNSQ